MRHESTRSRSSPIARSTLGFAPVSRARRNFARTSGGTPSQAKGALFILRNYDSRSPPVVVSCSLIHFSKVSVRKKTSPPSRTCGQPSISLILNRRSTVFGVSHAISSLNCFLLINGSCIFSSLPKGNAATDLRQIHRDRQRRRWLNKESLRGCLSSSTGQIFVKRFTAQVNKARPLATKAENIFRQQKFARRAHYAPCPAGSVVNGVIVAPPPKLKLTFPMPFGQAMAG